jgi:hypothetical protein
MRRCVVFLNRQRKKEEEGEKVHRIDANEAGPVEVSFVGRAGMAMGQHKAGEQKEKSHGGGAAGDERVELCALGYRHKVERYDGKRGEASKTIQ